MINKKGCDKMNYKKFDIKKQEYANRTLRFPVETLEKLNCLASAKNTSLNNVVVQCCEYALGNMDDENEEQEDCLD